MADTIGYVTLDQADEYIATHYISTDSLRTAWEGLSSDDKKALLLKSFDTIEILPFAGRKLVAGQEYAFPRYPDTEVPKAIKAAQIEDALSSADSAASEEAAHYGRLWQFGVQSYSIGNLSEHISEGAWSTGNTSAAASGLVSAVASRLLKPYLMGSYRVACRRCQT